MDFPLPNGYIYRLVKNEENKECIFQIKEISDKNQALRWLQDWSNLTKVTWRINRTYPRSGRHNCFKVDMKCQNAVNKRVKSVHTKKTGCTATLQIKITGFCENISADQDDFNRDWPTIITIRGTHNHELNNTETPNDLMHHDQTSSSDISENKTPTVSAEYKAKFNNLIARINSGIETKPEIFVPALRKMLENAEKFASTEAGLVRAMRTFGMCNATFVNNHAKKIIKKRHAVRTGVQPTATERTKKLCLR